MIHEMGGKGAEERKKKRCSEQDFCFSMTLCFIKTSRNKLHSSFYFLYFSFRCCVKGQRIESTGGRHIVEQFAMEVSLCEILSSARYWFMESVGTKGNKIITKYKFPSKSSAWRECVNSQRRHLSRILFSSLLRLNTLFIFKTCWWWCYCARWSIVLMLHSYNDNKIQGKKKYLT